MANARLIQSRKQRNMDVSSSSEVGDLVYISISNPNIAEVAQDNNTPRPIFGIIINKRTNTKATVLLDGIIELDTVISPGRLFLGVNGGFTSSNITENYLQELGVSFGDGTIDFSPVPRRVKKSN